MGYRSVIAIDPGNTTGFAIFWDALLWKAGTFGRGLIEKLPAPPLAPVAFVIEVPRVYPSGGKGDPNQLVDLGVYAGFIAGWLSARTPGLSVSYVAPRTWKGTAPKHITNARTVKQLGANEVSLLPRRPRAKDFDHNMLDAIGLGLWFLGKEGKRI